MPAVDNFRKALNDLQVDPSVQGGLFKGYETISDKDPKPKRAAFFRQAIQIVDETLAPETRHAIRDACACSKSGWRLEAAKKIAKEYAGKPLEEKLAALRGVTHMGSPSLQADGTILAGIGERGGFECPCPVFQGSDQTEPVSLTYCYCCAGHFRFHYQVALGVKLRTKTVLSSALNSVHTEPCRFEYEVKG
jgi:hypothetical protein